MNIINIDFDVFDKLQANSYMLWENVGLETLSDEAFLSCRQDFKIDLNLEANKSSLSQEIIELHEKIIQLLKNSRFGQPSEAIFVCVELGDEAKFHIDDSKYTIIVGLKNGFTEFVISDTSYHVNENSTSYPLNCKDVEFENQHTITETANSYSILFFHGSQGDGKVKPLIHTIPYKSHPKSNDNYSSAIIYTW